MTDHSETTTVYLLRHGDYENPKQIFHGRLPGFPLSQEGHKQAQHLAQKLADIPIAAVYASPLTRTRQTAQAIARVHGITVRMDDRLLDIKTPLQGKPVSYMESIQWKFYQPQFIAQGGETLHQMFARMDACIREKVRAHPGEHIVVISHGDPIMTIKVKYLDGNLRSRKPMYPYVPVAGGYTIQMDSKGIVLSISDFPEKEKEQS